MQAARATFHFTILGICPWIPTLYPYPYPYPYPYCGYGYEHGYPKPLPTPIPTCTHTHDPQGLPIPTLFPNHNDHGPISMTRQQLWSPLPCIQRWTAAVVCSAGLPCDLSPLSHRQPPQHARMVITANSTHLWSQQHFNCHHHRDTNSTADGTTTTTVTTIMPPGHSRMMLTIPTTTCAATTTTALELLFVLQ